MTVVNNILAMNAQRQFKIAGKKKSKTSEKLASGYRINRASDDAAGLAISEKMRRQIRGLTQGVNNCQEGISLCQVADGAMAEVHDMIQRMNELCVQAANGTNTDSDREAIDQEIQQIKKEIDRVGNETTFNEIKVLQGKETVETGEYTTEKRKETIYRTELQIQSVEKEGIIGQERDYDSSNTNVEYYLGLEPGKSYTWNIRHWAAGVYKGQLISYTIDFSKVQHQSDWEALDNSWFYISCPFGCGDGIRFVFDNSTTGFIDETPDYELYKQPYQERTIHVGTKGYQTGTDFLDDLAVYAEEKALKDSAHGTPYEHSTTGNNIGHQIGYKKQGSSLYVYYDNYYNGLKPEVDVNNVANSRIEAGGWSVKDVYGKYYVDEEVEVIVEEEVEVDVQVPLLKEIGRDIIIQYGVEAEHDLLIKLPHIDCEALEMTDVAGNPAEKALESLKTLSNALQKVSEERSRMGAYTNGLEHLAAAENNTIENTTAAESVIRDYDMAKGMVEYSNHSILEQVGTAMIAQANHINENILKLLQ